MSAPFSPLKATIFLQSRLPEYLRELERIVNIDSGTFDRDGVNRVCDALQSLYITMGATLDRYPVTDSGDNLVATLTGGGGVNVLLLGHTDTVYPLGTAKERLFRVSGNRALGPGVADMKSGDLMIVYALLALQDQSVTSFGTITVVHNSDEEIGSPRSRELIREHARRSDAVLVLEPGRANGDIVSARKGIVDFRVWVQGRAAHAGVNHDQGRSALLELAHLVVGLEALNGQIPGATLNVGKFDAGERPNVVPDRAFAHLEIRAPDQDSLDAMVQSVEEVVARRTVTGTTVRVESAVEHAPMHKSAESHRLVELANSLAGELGYSVNDVATGGASDGNTAAAAGAPVLDGLGPVGGGAHSPDEYIEIDSVVPRTAVLAGLVARASPRRDHTVG